MVGYIPDPKKSMIDYLDQKKYDHIRRRLGLFKILVGLITLIIIPLSLCIYLLLMLMARRFVLSDIPRMCEDVLIYSHRLLKTGFQDFFYGRMDERSD